jgi:hypothetical protein
MVEMVYDRIAAGETTVVSTAAVLRCAKQMEKLPDYNFSWTVSLQKQRNTSLKEILEEAQDRTLWRTQVGRGYGPVARQTNT